MNRWLWLVHLLLFVAIIGLWHAAVEAFGVSEFVLPRPADVGEATWGLLTEARTYRHLRFTVTETIVGFTLALTFGVSVGILLAKVPTLRRLLNPYIIGSQVVPKIAIAPLFIVWFGFGMQPKIYLSALIAFFPILTNTLLGVLSVEEGHRDVMLSLNVNRRQVLRRLEIPSSLPFILAGAEVGIVFAQIGAIVGEFLGGSSGFGFLLIETLNDFRIPRLFGLLVLLTGLGFFFFGMIKLLQRAIIPWHQSQRQVVDRA